MTDILLNGAPAQATGTVTDLVAELTGRTIGADGTATDGSPLGIAVAVNAVVVPRSRWGDAALTDGDEVEVLTAVQGD